MRKTTLTLDDDALALLQGAVKGEIEDLHETLDDDREEPWEWGESRIAELERLLGRIRRARERCHR